MTGEMVADSHREDVHLTHETGWYVVGAEELRPDRVLHRARAMIDLECSQLVCRNIPGCSRVKRRLRIRDAIDQPNIILPPSPTRETGIAQELVGRREQAEHHRALCAMHCLARSSDRNRCHRRDCRVPAKRTRGCPHHRVKPCWTNRTGLGARQSRIRFQLLKRASKALQGSLANRRYGRDSPAGQTLGRVVRRAAGQRRFASA